MRKTKIKWEYGDFQTPYPLAQKAVSLIKATGCKPASIIEPTCGKGSFLLAAFDAFPDAESYVAVEINESYLERIRDRIDRLKAAKRFSLINGDFFILDWASILRFLSEPILIIGNPPWVTSSELGILESKNLPRKTNFRGYRGYDAITGKSNFDISEWMLLRHLDWLSGRHGIIGTLCKTAVARKILFHIWKNNVHISFAKLYSIDAEEHFGASVDACFIVLGIFGGPSSTNCHLYNNIEAVKPSAVIGYHDGYILADVDLYKKWQHLNGYQSSYIWRSGIKHDCSSIMELEQIGTKYRNGKAALVSLEDEYLYPMLKSSDIANGGIRYRQKYMLVTQRFVGEDTSLIKRRAPKTWQYLLSYEELLANRASSIYRNKPRFSIFGIGSYSFSPWKVAISGFYKNLDFKIIAPKDNKPVVLDDTVYFLPCWSESEASFVADLLNSKPAQEFYRSMIFWSEKRPITIEILKRLNLRNLSSDLKLERNYDRFARQRVDNELEQMNGQLSLGITEKSAKYGRKRDRKRIAAQQTKRAD